GSGVYTASYTPTAAGTDNVAITLNGTAISGSPSASTVTPGAATQPAATGLPPRAAARRAGKHSITGRGGSGNVRSGSNDASLLSVTVSGGNTARPTVASAGSGVYTASYTPTTAGTDNVSITLNGTAISGSPSASTVSPGAATQLAVTGLPS